MWDICNIKTTAEVNAMLQELQKFYSNSKISIMNVYVNESRTLNYLHIIYNMIQNIFQN